MLIKTAILLHNAVLGIEFFLSASFLLGGSFIKQTTPKWTAGTHIGSDRLL